jgi:hypothetical protein
MSFQTKYRFFSVAAPSLFQSIQNYYAAFPHLKFGEVEMLKR